MQATSPCIIVCNTITSTTIKMACLDSVWTATDSSLPQCLAAYKLSMLTTKAQWLPKKCALVGREDLQRMLRTDLGHLTVVEIRTTSFYSERAAVPMQPVSSEQPQNRSMCPKQNRQTSVSQMGKQWFAFIVSNTQQASIIWSLSVGERCLGL